MAVSRDEELMPGVTMDGRVGGSPVQYEGFMDGNRYYFRARGGRWQLAVAQGPDSDEAAVTITLETPYNAPFYAQGAYDDGDGLVAGMMPLDQAEDIIRACAQAYRVSRLERRGEYST